MDKTCDLPGCENTAGDVKRCSLNQLSIGRCGMVLSIDASHDPHLKRRLLEMGLCNGTQIECVRRAPLGEQAKCVQVSVR
jgi:Fe2+ transport system protein FeoA